MKYAVILSGDGENDEAEAPSDQDECQRRQSYGYADGESYLPRRRSWRRSLSVVWVMWTGCLEPASRPSHLLNSSREAVMYGPLRSTGIPSLAQRCATATGCPRKWAMAGHPVSQGSPAIPVLDCWGG